jgi:diguanylate cyclase (GGDEF)-like protein
MDQLAVEESVGNDDFLKKFTSLEESAEGLAPGAWTGLARRYGNDFYILAIYYLTRKNLPQDEAAILWHGLLRHRQEMKQALGRDVGLRVAAADYFVNINQQVKRPLILESELVQRQDQNALTDALTGLYNRRFFNQLLGKEMSISRRHDQTFSLLMADVDHFKQYNDRFGHTAGDKALQGIAQALKNTARSHDYLIRYGGEEFAVILPKASRRAAAIAAERHRRAVEEAHFYGQTEMPGGNLTISVGLANVPEDAFHASDLVNRADLALYEAKRGGRNRIRLSDPDRRRHPRVDYRAEVDFRYLDEGRGYFRGQTLDISLGGVRMAVDQPVDMGRTLEFLIHPPEEHSEIKLEGSAVRVIGDLPVEASYNLGVALFPKADLSSFRDLVERQIASVH